MPKPILCIDFDGVIHQYTSGWGGEEEIPDPVVPGFFEWAMQAQAHFRLVIYSSRSRTMEGRLAMSDWLCRQMELWADRQDFPIMPSIAFEFAAEKPSAFLFIDDRALTFKGDWTEFDPVSLRDFKPWNKL